MAAPQPALTTKTHDACPNCGTELLGDFCHRCGEHKHHEEELGLKHFFLHAVHDLTHFDAKIFVTLRYLFTRPGFLTQEFIAGRRSRYVRPFSLFLVVCAIFFLADSIRPTSGYDAHQVIALSQDGKVEAAIDKVAKAKHLSKEFVIDRIEETMHRAATGAQVFNALAIAAVLALLFRTRYFVGHLVFSMHFLSFTFLVTVLAALLDSTPGFMNSHGRVSFVVTTLIFLVYLFIAMRRVYSQGTPATLVKAISIYAVTQVMIVVTLCGAVVVGIIRAAKAK